MEAELEDLTASLFEEAHKMVRDANVKQASAEKQLVEANMKVDGLETEVSALKTLVLTSTPSQPNKHLHPQLMQDSGKKKKGLKSSKNGNGSSESVASNNSLLFNGSSPITPSSACHRRLNSDSVDGAGGGRPSPQSSASSSPNPSLGGHSVNSEGMDDQVKKHNCTTLLH